MTGTLVRFHTSFCFYWTRHRYFDNFVLAIIIASSVSLCFDSVRLNPNSVSGRALAVLDILYCCVFVIEALMKAVAWGFIGGSVRHGTSPWL